VLPKLPFIWQHHCRKSLAVNIKKRQPIKIAAFVVDLIINNKNN